MLKINLSLKHLSIIITIIGITTLYILSILTQPTVITLDQISKYDGKEITTAGIVTEYYTTKYGSQIITIKEKNETVKIFLEGEIKIEIGDKLQTTGEVQKYKDEWEIIVNNKKSIKTIQKWSSNQITFTQLLENPEEYKNLNINISGYIDSIFDDYFILTDDDREHKIIVKYHDLKNTPVFKNNKINVLGKLIFDEKDFRYKILITEEKHGLSIYKEGI